MTTRAIGMVCFGSVGGSGTVAVELAHELAKRGHRVCLVARGRPARLAAEIEFFDVPTVEHALFESSPYTLSLAGVLSRVSAERSLDVIHLHYAVPHAASAILLAHTLGSACPALITTVHGTDVTTFGQHHALGAITGACLRSMDAVTTPSHYLRAKAAEAYGVDAVVVPNFVEPSVFTPRAAHSAPRGAAQRALTLVHVSSFRPVKATAELVPMMRSLCRSIEGGVRLVLIGEGPERARVMREAQEAGVDACMTFVPTIETPSELARWVAAADLFVLPSESESFGLAALEALACGVPVVARRVGGVPEVVSDGETGVLVQEAGDLAEAIAALAADRGRLAQMSSRAAADARRRFSPEVVTSAYEAVYQRAADVRAQRDA